MHIDEFRARWGYSRRFIKRLRQRGFLPPPRGHGPWSYYGPEHIAAIEAYRALHHLRSAMTDVSSFLREEGIDIIEYTRRRETAIKTHGLGTA